jgi:small subunit ribosomal protein S13
MTYILETELNPNTVVEYALKKIYGLGQVKATILNKKLGLSKNYKINELDSSQLTLLIKIIEQSKYLLGNDLKKTQITSLKALVSIKHYKGLRRIRGLPIRGQRTHTNAKTARKKI